ncbi:glutaredoxin family protein [Wenzhouxiangella limi]|uniref:Glutaredoxin family protein n=1 Tax=Wenzhouxiangella limi TaxID=2707351 RepID=A0A845V0U0_9GAMM|nr:glutaredoxin family protein [Wenzhouxiangella limi]NDY94896.1 glutaredoxin family protein [Wenzhouxiangella limi]
MRLILYTRSDCELCTKAEHLLAEAGFGGEVDKVFIDDDPELTERYGDQIPVLMRDSTGEKLSWPFTASQVRDLMNG